MSRILSKCIFPGVLCGGALGGRRDRVPPRIDYFSKTPPQKEFFRAHPAPPQVSIQSDMIFENYFNIITFNKGAGEKGIAGSCEALGLLQQRDLRFVAKSWRKGFIY